MAIYIFTSKPDDYDTNQTCLNPQFNYDVVAAKRWLQKLMFLVLTFWNYDAWMKNVEEICLRMLQ